MSQSPWQLAPRRADLQLAGLIASIDLCRPDLGVQTSQLSGSLLPEASVLGVRLLPAADDEPYLPPLIDVYVRGNDLVATYAPTDLFPLRSQIYWRAKQLVAAGVEVAAIDVQVSVQTNLLGGLPVISMQGSLLADAVLLGTATDGCEIVWRPCPQEDELTARQTSALLCRLLQVQGSYVELIHGTDAGHLHLTADERHISAGRRSWTQRLFAEDCQNFEKGVILRSRLRGAFLPRANDEQVAAAAWADLLAAPLQLST